jgi:hypothetical protein
MIKTPQLIGIIAGCLVFVVTISVVIYLLYVSGTFSKLVEELQGDAQKAAGGKGQQPQQQEKSYLLPQLVTIPELYDELIKARQELSAKSDPPPVLSQNPRGEVIVRPYDIARDSAELLKACNGSIIDPFLHYFSPITLNVHTRLCSIP